MESKIFKARNSNFWLKFIDASRPVISINDLLIWYIDRANKKLPLEVCYSWSASGNIWIKKPSSFTCLKFIQKCKIKDLGACASSPTRQPFSKLTTSQMAFSRGFILKIGDFFPQFLWTLSTPLPKHYEKTMLPK